MKVASKITDLIGNTPLLELNRYKKEVGLEDVSLLGKLECFNPLSSAKDRVALALIEDAEKKGLIGEGATIIEPTSGNTGVGLAFGLRDTRVLTDPYHARYHEPGAAQIGRLLWEQSLCLQKGLWECRALWKRQKKFTEIRKIL